MVLGSDSATAIGSHVAVGELAVRDGHPVRAAVGGFEDAAAGRTEIINLRLKK